MNPERGIALSVGASTLFALLSAYVKLLAPLSGLDIFAWRVDLDRARRAFADRVAQALAVLRQLLTLP